MRRLPRSLTVIVLLAAAIFPRSALAQAVPPHSTARGSTATSGAFKVQPSTSGLDPICALLDSSVDRAVHADVLEQMQDTSGLEPLTAGRGQNQLAPQALPAPSRSGKSIPRADAVAQVSPVAEPDDALGRASLVRPEFTLGISAPELEPDIFSLAKHEITRMRLREREELRLRQNRESQRKLGRQGGRIQSTLDSRSAPKNHELTGLDHTTHTPERSPLQHSRTPLQH